MGERGFMLEKSRLCAGRWTVGGFDCVLALRGELGSDGENDWLARGYLCFDMSWLVAAVFIVLLVLASLFLSSRLVCLADMGGQGSVGVNCFFFLRSAEADWGCRICRGVEGGGRLSAIIPL